MVRLVLLFALLSVTAATHDFSHCAPGAKHLWLIDNDLLKSKARGLHYRNSEVFVDKAPNDEYAPWYSVVEGTQLETKAVGIHSSWIMTTGHDGRPKYLPTKINGVQVVVCNPSLDLIAAAEKKAEKVHHTASWHRHLWNGHMMFVFPIIFMLVAAGASCACIHMHECVDFDQECDIITISLVVMLVVVIVFVMVEVGFGERAARVVQYTTSLVVACRDEIF
eukprot:gnl/TRDRNA2_/TRDRNA2_202796_c0_seq1.p1 gnl/TRDRNA2_/TRDRNA2_202796_c0~~gnl/TRDRNA2_/TRDRNA2_202796_c0_seq1.p1  ORF type:complete len:247 (+),score=22.06 gnl/TRDRNA2_/TRDRNA2_202796_c0_seq1:77-742(+)